MKYTHYLFLSMFICFSVSCSSGKEEEKTNEPTKTSKFSGNYNKAFNDMHDLHIAAAQKNGISPLKTRGEAIKMGDKLSYIPHELAYYRTDKLTHSSPYLVPKASDLMIDICINFRDSLTRKGLPLYKLALTSLTRTDEDITKLTKKNFNASHNSAHCYGTTFDISWKRYIKINPNDKDVSTEKLKFVLAEVLNDMKTRERCYIKHEKKQACFHITVR